MIKPVFRVKDETKAAYIASFRIEPTVHAKLQMIARSSGIHLSEVIRQMIDFALEHAEEKPKQPGGEE